MRSRLAVVLIVCLSCGCTFPRAKLVVTDPDPSIKIPAIQTAVEENDRTAAKQLVLDLESDDAAVRFYAINGLRRLTGEDFGYQYWEEDETRRWPAVERWKQWLTSSGLADVELERPSVTPP